MKTFVDYNVWKIAYTAICREVKTANVVDTLQERYGIDDWIVNNDFSQMKISCRDERLIIEFLLRYA